MIIRAYIFDLDGTLVDTERANYEAYRLAYLEVGIELSEEAYRSTFGLRFDAMSRIVAPTLTAEQTERVRLAKQRYYPASFKYLFLNHALVEFLKMVSQQTPAALATTGSRNNVTAVLDHFDLAHLFAHRIFGEDVTQGKPHPECYAKAIALFGVSAQECLVFEDSTVGMAAASAAGAHVVQVPRPEFWAK